MNSFHFAKLRTKYLVKYCLIFKMLRFSTLFSSYGSWSWHLFVQFYSRLFEICQNFMFSLPSQNVKFQSSSNKKVIRVLQKYRTGWKNIKQVSSYFDMFLTTKNLFSQVLFCLSQAFKFESLIRAEALKRDLKQPIKAGVFKDLFLKIISHFLLIFPTFYTTLSQILSPTYTCPQWRVYISWN